MFSPNEFWLNLHRLSESYDSEGANVTERAAHITRQFQDMPGLAQQEVLQELHRLAIHLPELYAVVAAAANGASPRYESAKRREDVA